MSLSPVRQVASLVGLATVLTLVGPARTELRADDRSDVPITKALVGHWRSHSGAAEYYWAEGGELVLIDENGARRQDQTYTVTQADADEEVLTVEVKVPSTGGGHKKELRMATDRMSLMSTIRTVIDGRTYIVNTTWNYVDDLQKPPKKGAAEKS